ncbi:MAG: SDR family oxidoreductase [Saprospiraceae bacterium]|nr:SDR family oxidoreductase [Saprospiraceae bacterium]
MDLSQLKVLVTGGAGIGVGGGVCEALDAGGATIIINDIDGEKAHTACKKYNKAIPIQADISQGGQVERMFGEIKESVGSINGLVNNAGIGLSKLANEVTEAEFDRLYNVDMRAVWLVTKYFINQLLDQGITGNIVNVSSVHAFSTMPKYAIYASAKSAVEGFTRGIAYEMGRHNIRCNAIAPGMVHAEQNYDLMRTWTDDPKQWERDFMNDHQALQQLIQPIDCGHAVAFLLSNLSRSITGQTLYVDAGTTIMIAERSFVEKD